MNKKGFIATSLIFAFFILFVGIMTSLLINYAHSRVLIRKANQEIVNDLVNKTSFNYIGSVQTYQTPYRGYYKIDLYGAQGGSSSSGVAGAKGGYSSGIIFLEKNVVLNIYVGGKGSTATAISQTATKGYNGGGMAGFEANCTSCDKGAGGGGGATDVRIGGTTLSNRVIVAGGGGGAANWSSPKSGGIGGGLIGEDGTEYQAGTNPYVNAKGGTQLAGGAAGYSPSYTGQAGSLGNGGNSHVTYGGGGGGGYYGGGGGAVNTSVVGSGGGGSGYISGHLGCTVSPDAVFSQTIMESGVNLGNGKAMISFIGINI